MPPPIRQRGRDIDSVRIVEATAYQYTMPLLRPFGTARGRTTDATNVLVTLRAQGGGRNVEAVGESTPRGSLTGDRLEPSWEFLGECLEALVDTDLTVADPAAAVAGVRDRIEHLRLRTRLGGPASTEVSGKAFRGTLLGLEVALLDLVARAANRTVAELLGRRRSRLSVSANTVSAAQDTVRFEQSVKRQLTRYPVLRWKGSGDIAGDLARLEAAAGVHRSMGRGDKPIWIDVNQGMSADSARSFVLTVAERVRAGRLPSEVILEQPSRDAAGGVLGEFQRIADECLSSHPGRVLIMADESVWGSEDLAVLWREGTCAAINIKAPKAGGLLASLELAERALSLAPNTRLYLGGMLGTSDVTAWTLVNLALALPRLDYLTLVPPTNVEARISNPRLTSRKGTNRLTEQRQDGIGTELDMATLARYVERSFSAGEPPAGARGVVAGPHALNRFDEPHLRRFPGMSLDSHLIEREALRFGLGTLRLTRTSFVVEGPDEQVGFHWSAATATTRFATTVSGSKQLARALLADAGIPVPRGRIFAASDERGALKYADGLGYPVVAKPAAGTGGIGVRAGIATDDELLEAVRALERTRYAGRRFLVEEHVPGTDYRFLVMGDRVVSVLKRRAAHVIGDGRASIAELVLQKNRRRQENPHLAGSPLKLGDAAAAQLKRQGLQLDAVPAAGSKVVLASAGNLSQGGESREVLDEVHASLLAAAVRARQAIPGLGHAGIDILIEDHRQPCDGQRVSICEVNSMPGIKGHCFPLYGPARNVALELVRHYCGDSLPEHREDDEGVFHVALMVRGQVQDVGYRSWLRRRANEFGVRGRVSNHGEGEVHAELSGEWRAVTAIASMAIRGPRAATVDLARARPSAPFGYRRGFAIVSA